MPSSPSTNWSRLPTGVVTGDQRPVHRHDESGRLRVVAEAGTAVGIVDASFHQLRQAARTNTAVTLRLLETIAAVAPQVGTEDLRTALLSQAEMTHQGSQKGLVADWHRENMRERCAAVVAAFRVNTK